MSKKRLLKIYHSLTRMSANFGDVSMSVHFNDVCMIANFDFGMSANFGDVSLSLNFYLSVYHQTVMIS